MAHQDSGTDCARRAAALQLALRLREPLTAACNYVGAAHLVLGAADREGAAAIEFLDRAETEILRAGELARQIQVALDGAWPEPSSLLLQ